LVGLSSNSGNLLLKQSSKSDLLLEPPLMLRQPLFRFASVEQTCHKKRKKFSDEKHLLYLTITMKKKFNFITTDSRGKSYTKN
jgi:hypothetical protein